MFLLGTSIWPGWTAREHVIHYVVPRHLNFKFRGAGSREKGSPGSWASLSRLGALPSQTRKGEGAASREKKGPGSGPPFLGLEPGPKGRPRNITRSQRGGPGFAFRPWDGVGFKREGPGSGRIQFSGATFLRLTADLFFFFLTKEYKLKV